jgi:hypothetical protein
MSGAIPPLPLYAFMAWTGTIYLYTKEILNVELKLSEGRLCKKEVSYTQQLTPAMLCCFRTRTFPAHIDDHFGSSFIYVAVMTHSLAVFIFTLTKLSFTIYFLSPPRTANKPVAIGFVSRTVL